MLGGGALRQLGPACPHRLDKIRAISSSRHGRQPAQFEVVELGYGSEGIDELGGLGLHVSGLAKALQDLQAQHTVGRVRLASDGFVHRSQGIRPLALTLQHQCHVEQRCATCPGKACSLAIPLDGALRVLAGILVDALKVRRPGVLSSQLQLEALHPCDCLSVKVQLGAQGSNSRHQVEPVLGLPAKLLDQNVALLQRGIRVDDVRHWVLDVDAAFHAVIHPLQLRDGREHLVLVETVSQFNALAFVRAASVQCPAAHHLFVPPGHKTKRNQQALCCGIFRHGDAIDDLVTAAWKGQRRTALHQQQPAGVKRQKQIVLCHRLNQSMAKPGKAPGLHRSPSGDGVLKLRPARKP